MGLSACQTGEEAWSSSPNILWVLAEDLSPDLGCYGHDLVQTPQIDALAAKGRRFTWVFTTASACRPSRTAMATSIYQTAITAHHLRYPDALRNPFSEKVILLNEGMSRGNDCGGVYCRHF